MGVSQETNIESAVIAAALTFAGASGTIRFKLFNLRFFILNF